MKQLKGFKRVDLNPGEERSVEIAINKDELRFYDRGEWILDPAYTVYVGNNCQNVVEIK